ncbi:MAG TPA: hypothetical protein VL382_01480, partial [Terriglobales bacterium]|nr:hypothetical protein [Terriglobales bacterium]
YENRMPASPLSNADRVRSGAIQQEVPFGAATIKPAAQPPANTVRPPAQQARVAPQKAQSKPSPQASKPAATRPRHKQRFADDGDMIATDEVVYHGAPKKPANATGKPTSTQNAQNVKKISDIGDQ